MNLQRISFRRYLVWGLYLIPLYPFVFWGDLFFPFITGKTLFLYTVIETLFALFILALINREVRFPSIRSPIFVVLAAFFLLFSISTITSVDPAVSFWSTFERMDGLLTWLHLGALFLILSSVPTPTEWKRILMITVGTYALIIVSAFLSLLFSAEPPGRIGGVFGNPAYFSTFVLLAIFLIGLFFQNLRAQSVRVFFILLIVLGVLALLFAGTRGSIIALIAGAGVVVFLSPELRVYLLSRMRRFRTAVTWLIAGALLIALFAISGLAGSVPLFNRTLPTSITALQSEPRILVWQETLKAVREKPLFGWGHGNFDVPFDAFYNPLLSLQELWFDHAHNVFLDWSVAGGIPLALAYLGLFISAAFVLFSRLRPDPFSQTERAVLTGLLTSYLVNGFFLFDSVAGLLILIGVFAYISGRQTREQPAHGKGVERLAWRLALGAGAVSITLVALLTLLIVPAVQGAYYARIGLTEELTGDARLVAIRMALEHAPFDRAGIAARFGTAVMQVPPTPANSAILENTRALVYEETLGNKARHVSHLMVNGLLASRAGDFETAIVLLKEARERAPNRKNVNRTLAEVYTEHGDFEPATEAYREVYRLESLFPAEWKYQYYIDQAFKDYVVSTMYTDDLETAEGLLEGRFGTAEIYDTRLIETYLYRGRVDRVANILEARLKEAPGGQVCFSLAAAYLKARNISRSVDTLVRCGNQFPETRLQAEALIEAIHSGSIDVDSL